jgi:hypothetical protein
MRTMSMVGLPRHEFRKTENIHFLSTSNIVPSIPLGKSIARDLQGIYKNELKQQLTLVLFLNFK